MGLTSFGLHFASTSYPGVESTTLFEKIRTVALAAESSGFDSLWVPDHAMQNDIGGGRTGPMLEAYVLLAALAAVTSSAKLGALVSPVTFRNPALLAKTLTSIDVISGGRAILGIGAAWDTEEHAAYGVEFPGVGDREDLLEEAIGICREMFTEPAATLEGRRFSVAEAFNFPRPIQQRIPILVGGGGERRTLRTVAKYADACNLFGSPEAIRLKLDVLASHCAEVGRSFGSIATTASLFPPDSTDELVTAVGERREVGIDGVILLARDCPDAETVEQWGRALSGTFG
jgi:F420-dependent oxidoreductase-like protein